MKIGDFDIELTAETRIDMLNVMAYYCAYDGTEAETAQVRQLLQAKLEQCTAESLKSQAQFALSMLSKQQIETVDFSDFDSYSAQEQITLLAKYAYTDEAFSNCAHYDNIKNIRPYNASHL
jgi:hypothetical protein